MHCVKDYIYRNNISSVMMTLWGFSILRWIWQC